MQSRRLPYFVIFTTAFLASTVLFAAHFSPNGDSADGTEIRWEDQTIYDDARIWATNEWDALGSVNWEPDAWNTVTDLEWEDADNCSASWAARRVVKSFSPDHIEFNKCYMKDYTTYQRRLVATHEGGHAVGLGDHTSSDHSSAGIIMWNNLPQMEAAISSAKPQSHDISDYNSYW